MNAVLTSSPRPGVDPLDSAKSSYRLVPLEHCLAIGSISESTFYRLVRAGAMPAPQKIGRVNRWVEAEVIAAYKRLTGSGDE